MAEQLRKIATLRLDGAPYKDHGMDANAAKVFFDFQELVRQADEVLWQRDHPDRQKLPSKSMALLRVVK